MIAKKTYDFDYEMSSLPENWWQTGNYLYQVAEDNYKLDEKRRVKINKKIQIIQNFDYFNVFQLYQFSFQFKFPIPRFSVYYLLIGYSIENWLKGFYIAVNKKVSSVLYKNLQTHDLICLCNDVKFKILKMKEMF